MMKTDQQVKSNDCGISAVKTVYNIFGRDISRKYIEQNIPLEQKGSRLFDIKEFFTTHGCTADYKLLDIHYIQGNTVALHNLFPFILPIKSKEGLHYVVVNNLKGNKLKIHDPGKGTDYYLPLQELKKRSHYARNIWEAARTEEKITALCAKDLDEYHICITEALQENDFTTLFNKLTYFTYLKEQFGFKDKNAEKKFLHDLLTNQEISSVPKHFKTLKYNRDKVTVTAPLILTVKPKNQKENPPLPKEEKKNLYWQLFQQLGQFRQFWYIYIFAALVSAGTAQLSVFTNQLLIDEVLPSYNLGTLTLFVIGLGVYKLFDLGTSVYKSFVGVHLGNLLDKYFLFSFEQKMNTFSLPFIQSYKKGDLMERMSDSIKLKLFFQRLFTNILVDVCISIYSLIALFFINPRLTFVVIGVIVLFYGWFKLITPTLKQNEQLRYLRKADFLSKMMEKVEGIQVIKSFRTEHFHSHKIQASINEYLNIQLKNGYTDLINKSVVAVIIIISSILIITLLIKSAIQNQAITLGQIVTFITLSSKIFASLKSILDDNLSLQENEVILQRFMDFKEINIEGNQNGISEFSIKRFEIQNVHFGYSLNEQVLKNINLQIHKGQKIKIEGQNGSGKSTLSKILTGLYQPRSGAILINETDRKFYNIEAIKDKILLVTNEDILFNDTIESNIALGKDISTSKILELAKRIGFYDFIASKDEGLDFIINENGKNLSTGQRKKILLLRAFFSEAEMIILDEVLSGMDAESREKAEQFINDEQEKIVIVISHEPIHHIEFSKKYKILNGELNIL